MAILTTCCLTFIDLNEIYISSLAPINPTNNQIWFDTNLNVVKKYNSSKRQWEVINDYSEEIKDAIDNLQVTGKNLLANTSTSKDIVCTGATLETGATFNFTKDINYLNDIKGNQIALAFDWEYIGNNPSGTFYIRTVAPQLTLFTPKVTISSSKKYGTQFYTTTINSSQDTTGIEFVASNITGTIRITHPRIFLGSKDLGWSQAPEDIENKFQTIFDRTSKGIYMETSGDGYKSLIDINNKKIKIASESITLEGYTTINKKFIIDEEGKLTATDASFSGNITSATMNAVSIYSGTINIGSNFSVDDKGNMKAKNASFTGTIESGSNIIGARFTSTNEKFKVLADGTIVAADGKFSGTITSSTIAGGSIGIGGSLNDNFIVDSNGNIISKGTANLAKGNFIVDSSGNITAKNITSTNANFSGNISSSTIKGGTIGIGGTDNSNFSVDTNGNIISKGTANLAKGNFVVNSDGNITAKNITATNASFTGTIKSGSTITGATFTSTNNKFKVLADGTIEAIGGKFSGTITGSNITGGTIGIGGTDNSNFVVDSNGSIVSKGTANLAKGNFVVDINGNIIAKNITATNASFSGNINSSTIRGGTIGIGGTNNNNFTVDSSGNIISKGTANLANGNFVVDGNGNIITKNITATNAKFSGQITGSTIATNSNKFSVDSNGIMKCSDAVFSGAITSSTIATTSNKFSVDSNGIMRCSGAIIDGTFKTSNSEISIDKVIQNAQQGIADAKTASDKATTAQNTANSKAKVFTSTPTVPYKVGDLWTVGPSGELMRCKTARSSGSYTASDWEKASKYTDDTKANAVDGKVNNLQTDYNSTKNKVSEIVTDLNSITQRVSSTEKKVITIANTANNALDTASIANSKVDGLEIGGRNYLINSAKINLSNSDVGRDFTRREQGKITILKTNSACNAWTSWNGFGETPYGLDITCSVDIKINKISNAEMTLGVGDNRSENREARYNLSIFEPNKWVRVSATGIRSSNPWNLLILEFFGNIQSGLVIEYKNFKCEIGNKATDWTSAPEDTQTQIDANKTEISTTKSKVSTIETDLKGITSRVSAVETNQTTTGNKVTSLESWKKEAEQKITETAITNTVKKNFYTKSETDSQITSKGYQTASQVQQTVNGLQVKVSQSGGYNLIKNSTGAGYNTNSWTHNGSSLGVGYNDTIGSNCRTYIFLDNGTTTSEKYAFSSRFKLKPNTKYTFVGYFHNYNTCRSFDVFLLSSTSLPDTDSSTNYTNAQQLIATASTSGTWKKYKVTVTTPANTMSGYIRIDNNGYNSGGGSDPNRVHWNALMLTEGELELPWSSHPSELYDGITTIDKDGIKISMQDGEGSQGYTRIAHDGMEIFDSNGSRIAHFGDSNTAYINTLTADKINNRYLLRWNEGRPRDLYVAPNATGDGTGRDANNKANSISNTLDWLWNTYGCYSWQSDIVVHVAPGDYWGADNYIGGWLGTGVLYIVLEPWACIRSTILIRENTMPIVIRSSADPYNIEVQDNAYLYLNSDSYGIHVRNSTVVVAGINMQCEGWYGDTNTWGDYRGYGVYATDGSNVLITNCDIVGFWYGCGSTVSSYVSMLNCVGHVGCTGVARDGGILSYDRALPMSKDGFWRDIGGFLWNSGGTWASNSKFAPKPEAPQPPPPAPVEKWVWTENTFWASSLWTAPEGSGSGTSGRSGCWGQGKWGSYKPHRGYASFSGVNAWCDGGRNFTVELIMTRQNTSHGLAGAVPVPKIKTTNGSFWNCGQAFARGDTHTVTLPADVANALVTGGWDRLEMWAGTSTNDYSFYDNVKIRVICEKRVQ